MRSFTETIPMSVIEGDCDGEFEVMFDWSPGTPEFIPPLNRPEAYDPGSADEFVIRGARYVLSGGSLIQFGLAPHEEERVIEHLDAEWERPDDEADQADDLRDQRRDDQMEQRA